MAVQTTKPYRNSFSGSVGAGMGSLFNPNGRRYFILEHKVSSKYHKAGESQEIIVDNIELGRDPHCQVRFDESFHTVSRHHAGIVKDGDNWKLVQISKTNSTLLNGHPVKTEWYLQNGDEIQLSVNGPKLGFIIPSGNKATVGSIGLSRRLSLFRQQALAPYRYAITALSILLILSIGGLGMWNYFLQEDASKKNEQIAELMTKADISSAQADSLAKELVENNKKLKDYEKRMSVMAQETAAAKKQAQDAFDEIADMSNKINGEEIPEALATQCFPFTYAIYQVEEVIKLPNGEIQRDDDARLVGSGFLLSDGRFVTARHVTETYYYYESNWGDERINALLMFQNAVVNNGGDITTTFVAISHSGDQIQFTNKQCNVNRATDKATSTKLNDGTVVVLKKAGLSTSDWVSYRTSKIGLPFDNTMSVSLQAGTKLKVLGFPYGRGGENPRSITPISSSAEVAREGLDVDGTIMASNNDTQSGNSGGPVFIWKDGKYRVIGLLSGSTAGKGRIVPIKEVH